MITRFMDAVEALMEGAEHGKDIALLEAQKAFEQIAASKDTPRLAKAAAHWYAAETIKFRREWKKVRYGNGNYTKFDIYKARNRAGWDDVDVACVVLGPNNYKFFRFMAKLLGRSTEAVRFIHRYVHASKRPTSWVASTERYARVAQAKNVASKIGF